MRHVYVRRGAMFLTPPGRIIYHFKGRHIFPRYVHDPEASERVGYAASKPEGEEHGWTLCGRTTYLHVGAARATLPMEAIRFDIAVKIGRECYTCRKARRRMATVWEHIDIPVINGVATLPDGRTVGSTSQIVRIVVDLPSETALAIGR